MVHQESYLSNMNVGNETSFSKRSQLFVDQSALLKEKLYPRKSVSTRNTLFCIKLEYWMEALQ